MKKSMLVALTALTLGSQIVPTATALAQEDFSTVMITDQGGVDDKSFNQSAWEGLQAWGEENGKEEGTNGYSYLESAADSDYITNINTAMQGGFNLIYGIGFKLESAIDEMAAQYPDQQFAIVDAVVDQPNVASINFRDHEAAFLAGVAAASTTETDHIGLIGGVEGVVLDRFEAGFVAGAQTINPDIEISIEYVGSFADAPKAKQLASAMYSSGADIIYQTAGDSGNGVFSEARDRVENDPEQNIWVIGVDMDQTAEGQVTEDRNITLTSTLKQVGTTVKEFANETMNGNFQPGTVYYGLEEDAVGITEGQLDDETKQLIEDYKQQIIDGEIEVPETPEA